MKKIYRAMAGIILALLLAIGLASLFTTGVGSDGADTSKPQFSMQALLDGTFISKLETWYTNTFPMRDTLLKANRWLNGFYFGDAEKGAEDADIKAASIARHGGLKSLVDVNLENIDARKVNSIRLYTDAEGRDVFVRVGRYGPYSARTYLRPLRRMSLTSSLQKSSLRPHKVAVSWAKTQPMGAPSWRKKAVLVPT